MTRDRRQDDDILEAAFDALRPDSDGDGILPHLDDLAARRAVDTVMVLKTHQMRPAASRRRRKAVRTAVASAAGLLLITAGVVIMRSGRATDTSSTSIAAATSRVAATEALREAVPGSRFALLSGEVFCGGRKVTVGTQVPASEPIRTANGKAVLSLPSHIAVGLFENASARVLWSEGEGGNLGVSLIRGSALFSVDPTAPRKGFYVETPAGTVRVKGTLFTVTVSPKNGVFVKLHKGTVTLVTPDGRTESLEGTALRSFSGQDSDLAVLDETIDRQLQTMRVLDDGALFTELKRLDDKNASLNSHSPTETHARHPGYRLSIQNLMREARIRKAEGDWQGAAQSYNKLIQAFGTTDEAGTSRVSLGQIYLIHLHRPKDALREFDRYLSTDGPLSQEALWGKARALRAMNRSESEIETLRTFLRRYPNGILAKSVERRLFELRAAVN